MIFRDRALKGRKCLDQIEGEGSNYERIKIQLLDNHGHHIDEEVFAYTVISTKRKFGIKTSEKYTNYIIDGLSELAVPLDYIDYIKDQIRRNNPNIKV